jgi:hypothetical protein
MKRLVLFVEGEGEAEAVPTLVKRLLKERTEWPDILLDDSPFRVGSVDKLVEDDIANWKLNPAGGDPM